MCEREAIKNSRCELENQSLSNDTRQVKIDYKTSAQ